MHRKGKGKGKTEKGAHITFSSIYEQDLMMSFASNLPKDLSVEVVIPDHQLMLKRYLDNFAYIFRTHARENNLDKKFPSIRLEDSDQTLVLPVKDSKNQSWKSYTREELRSLDANLKHRAKVSRAQDRTTSVTSSSATDIETENDLDELLNPLESPNKISVHRIEHPL